MSADIPHTLMADLSTAGASAGRALMDRRGKAIANYWRAVAQVHEPAELFAVQLDYWNQLADDYSRAFSEAVAPAAEGQVPAAEESAKPPRAA
jgi:hypothetical protein